MTTIALKTIASMTLLTMVIVSGPTVDTILRLIVAVIAAVSSTTAQRVSMRWLLIMVTVIVQGLTATATTTLDVRMCTVLMNLIARSLIL